MIQNIISKSINRFGIFIVLIIATATRLIHLGQRDFWYDETFTGIALQEPFTKMMDIIAHDVHPPLYYLGAKLFSSVFGYSVFGIRLYSALFGVLCVAMVYLIVTRLFDKKAGLWAAFITSIAPFAVQYSQEARMYSQLAFLILCAAFFLFLSLKENEKRNAVLWGVMLGLAMLTHYMAILFIPVFGAIILIWKLAENNQRKGGKHAILIIVQNFFIGIVTCILIFLPWAQTALLQYDASDSAFDWITQPTSGDLTKTMQIFYFGSPPSNLTQGQITAIKQVINVPNSVVTIATILTLVLASIVVISKNKKNGMALTLLCVGPIVLLFGASFANYNYFVSRYLLPSAFFLFALLGIAVSYIKPKFRYVPFALYIACLLSIQSYEAPKEWNMLKRDLTRYESGSFYVLNPFDYVIAKYYFGADRVTLFNAENPKDTPIGWAAIGDTLQSSSNQADMAKKNIYIISHLELNSATLNPPTLSLLTFHLVNKYDALLVYEAISLNNQKEAQPGQ